MTTFKPKVVIIGGGITGLAAAYKIQNQVKEQNIEADLTLIEANHRLGGKIQTAVRDGFVIEKGPDSFLERKKSMERLIREVGLGDQLVPNSTGQAFILTNDKLHPMPGGSIMGIPTKIKPFMTTDLLSVTGKLRAAGDFVLPRSKTEGDQSLGAFFRRRLGDEIVENLIEPLLSGIYAGDIDQISLMSTFPQYHQLEKEHRSLIAGIKKTTPAAPLPKKPLDQQRKKSLFLTLSTGLESLITRLEEVLTDFTVQKGVRVEGITEGVSSAHRYNLQLSSGAEIEADTIIFTVPHYTAASVFEEHDLLKEIADVPATSVATVAMAFPEDQVKNVHDGTGFVVSRNSDYTITACTWTHNKWPHTVPDGKVLLRCYVGRAGDEAIVDLSDSQIEQIVLEDLKKIMDVEAKPEFTIVTRWKRAMPQYTVGHRQRMSVVRAELEQKFPGVYLAGASYDGIGLPDCIDQGELAALKALAFVKPGV
ncbi:protoporphyrinogen oxidase [Jeotgalibacillus sp. R-1-5s-1]|uniref:protoporphyrinogen oxidase n=1 Tax=Jeotgalibacillus sp. R-1-5s-1 TaxID=2555897 RepID=UPI00106C4419|nr:protoporphyrinogen oxidase [Jeotgalibacillus sp. R-1-5s-1]TFD97651.1 protoporphyrinogen oxidase [Jeotgalibacillus sp. R-1-5s-1]